MKATLKCTLTIALLALPATAAAIQGIYDSKHNLSYTGPGEVKATSESRICIFCHTPHNATPLTPLWNRDVTEGTNYDLYDSSTFNVTLAQPTGPSRLCLGCHDGTVGISAVLSVSGGIQMERELVGRPSHLGTDLTNDHPFSFSYNDAVPFNNELKSTPPGDLLIYNNNFIHCSTCHEPHDNTYGMFLAVDNRYSALCTRCHMINNWPSSTHAVSNASWGGAGTDPWPVNSRLDPEHQRLTVAENGCENCHTPHNAGGPERLLNYLPEEDNCIAACHRAGGVGNTDIASQFNKVSNHPLTLATIGDASGNAHDPVEIPNQISGHVECQDCHDPHSVVNSTAIPPNVNGRIANVSGVGLSGASVDPVQFEYEVCFKCHSETNNDTSLVLRYLESTNKRLEFATSNPSFHPVAGIGRNPDVPSIPSLYKVDMTASSLIYCTDCHDSDESPEAGGGGPKGPHGSIYPPILRERYETTQGTGENFTVYALCYRCHDRDNILSDASFRKSSASGLGGHSGHLAAGGGTPCSVCHDPHGVVDDGQSGSHTNLINFDTTVVSPVSGQSVPLFNDNGLFTGSCTLVCHGVTHDGGATYSYP